jgi:integrase
VAPPPSQHPKCALPPWLRSRPWPTPSRRSSAPLVLVAAYTGLRWGELAGLRVKRVDLLHGRITVVEQLLEVRGQLAFGPTKTGAGLRTVTLPSRRRH